MARIRDSELDRLKREVSLQRLVEAQGIALASRGADLLGLCPFRQDREPSLVVSPKKNLWHGLGACQTGGSVIDWVMRSRGVSFRHAVDLRRKDHPSLATAAPIVARGTTAAVKLDTPFEADADDQRVLRQVADTYHETLKQSPEALQYLESRGLTHPGDDRALQAGLRQPHAGLPAAGQEPQEQRRNPRPPAAARHPARVGPRALRRVGGHPRLRPRRQRHPNLREGTPLYPYLAGRDTGVWNELALQVSPDDDYLHG